jgi:hypothetical protein
MKQPGADGNGMTVCALPADASRQASVLEPALAHPAVEVLGALAPCEASGPHGRDSLRRRTRLVRADFDDALRDLLARGWLSAEGAELWVTSVGEEALSRLFA